MMINPREEARQIVLDTLRLKQQCNTLEELIEQQLRPTNRNFSVCCADLHAASKMLDELAVKLLKICYVCPDRQIELVENLLPAAFSASEAEEELLRLSDALFNRHNERGIE